MAEKIDPQPERDEFSSKASAPAYAPAPFYFLQTTLAGEKRYAAWSGKRTQMRAAVEGLLAEFPETVLVLFKAEEGTRGHDADGWTRYFGEASRAALQQAIADYERTTYEDGATQLLVRREDTGEYFALDQCGVLFIYSEAEKYADLLRSLGFENRTEPLLTEIPHWTHYFKRPDRKLAFIAALGLRVGDKQT